MKKTATDSRLLVLGALCAVFFVLLSPWVVSAATLRANPVSDTIYPIGSYPNAMSVVQQGIGYETFFSSSTPIGGVQLWFTAGNATSTDKLQVCILESKPTGTYTGLQSFMYLRSASPGAANSYCVSQKFVTDANGLVTIPLSIPWSADPSRYMWVQISPLDVPPPNDYVNLDNWIGSTYSNVTIPLYAGTYASIGGNTMSATSTGSVYFVLFSGATPTPFDAARFIPSVSTTTVQQSCGSNLATSSGLVDSVGAAVSYGACVAGTFLFVPSQDSLESFRGIPSVLPTIIPFSYFYDFQDIINGENASSSTNFQPLSVNLASTGVGSTSPYGQILNIGGSSTFAYLSTTTIMTYVSQSLYDTLFLLMRSAIWVVVALHIFRRLRPGHVTHA